MTERWRMLPELTEGIPPPDLGNQSSFLEVKWVENLRNCMPFEVHADSKTTRTPVGVNPSSVSKWESTSRSRCDKGLSYHCPHRTTDWPQVTLNAGFDDSFLVPFFPEDILFSPVLFHSLPARAYLGDSVINMGRREGRYWPPPPTRTT